MCLDVEGWVEEADVEDGCVGGYTGGRVEHEHVSCHSE